MRQSSRKAFKTFLCCHTTFDTKKWIFSHVRNDAYLSDKARVSFQKLTSVCDCEQIKAKFSDFLNNRTVQVLKDRQTD